MQVYLLSRKIYSKTLSGKGAAVKGARWNSPGIEMIYTAANRSLAMAEVAVHLSLATLPSDFMMVTIHIPEKVRVLSISEERLPMGWNDFPHPATTQAIGDKFIVENKFCVLQIPSAVTKGDFNFLINPLHKDFALVKIVAIEIFPFDTRLFE